MAQQHLHHAQIGAVVQQMRGEGVPQHVATAARARRPAPRISSQNAWRVMASPRPVMKSASLTRPAASSGRARQILVDPVRRLGAQRHQPVLPPLPSTTRTTPSFRLTSSARTPTSSTRRPVAYSVSSMARSRRPRGCSRSGRAARHPPAPPTGSWHARRLLGRLQRQAGSRSAMMLAQGPGVEAAQRRQPPVGRGRAGLFMAEREPGFDVGLAGLRQRLGRPAGSGCRQPPRAVIARA